MKILKLNEPGFDSTLNIQGTTTHCCIRSDGSKTYLFQPKGLKKNGKPHDAYDVVESDIDGPKEEVADVNPNWFKGDVTDKVTGFTGRIIRLVLHPTGCVHAIIRQRGLNQESGEPWEHDHNCSIHNLVLYDRRPFCKKWKYNIDL